MDWKLQYTKRLLDLVKRNDVKTILHICGDTEDRLESMAETGIYCLNLDEVIDFEKARKMLGANYFMM